MIENLFAEHIAAEFPHALTEQQKEAARQIGAFLADPRSDRAFILRGYAGTGKTSLISAVVRVWKKLNRPVLLLAPTGRAAKVFSLHSGLPPSTKPSIVNKLSKAKTRCLIEVGTTPRKHSSLSMSLP